MNNHPTSSSRTDIRANKVIHALLEPRYGWPAKWAIRAPELFFAVEFDATASPWNCWCRTSPTSFHFRFLSSSDLVQLVDSWSTVNQQPSCFLRDCIKARSVKICPLHGIGCKDVLFASFVIVVLALLQNLALLQIFPSCSCSSSSNFPPVS